MATKKAAAAKAESAEESTATDVAETEQGVRENNPAGVHEALKGPTSADLNPAFN